MDAAETLSHQPPKSGLPFRAVASCEHGQIDLFFLGYFFLDRQLMPLFLRLLGIVATCLELREARFSGPAARMPQIGLQCSSTSSQPDRLRLDHAGIYPRRPNLLFARAVA